MPDATAPFVGNFDPVTGSTILINEAIEFDITDNLDQIQNEFVWVSYPDGSTEVIFDGAVFTAPFVTNSKREAITNGFHYKVRRFQGWPASPTIKAKAIDQDGNESPNP